MGEGPINPPIETLEVGFLAKPPKSVMRITVYDDSDMGRPPPRRQANLSMSPPPYTALQAPHIEL